MRKGKPYNCNDDKVEIPHPVKYGIRKDNHARGLREGALRRRSRRNAPSTTNIETVIPRHVFHGTRNLVKIRSFWRMNNNALGNKANQKS